MKYRVAGLVAIAIAFALTFVGVALANGPDTYNRYHQHEEARSLDDLSPEEREAASSTSIEPESFASHLPVVSIDTEGREIPGEPILDESGDRAVDETGIERVTLAEDGSETIPVTLSLFDNENDLPDKANRLSDDPEFTTQAEMKIRGHSSVYFDKQSYRLTFTLDDRVTPNPQNVLGMGVEEDWVLSGPYLDKTLMRNYLSYNVFGELMPYTPDVRYVELFIDGKYQGLYLLMETVKVGDDRVDIRKSDLGQAATSFLVGRDWENAVADTTLDEFLQDSYQIMGTTMEIDYPPASKITPEQKEYIEDELNRIEKQLYSYDYDEPGYGYWTTLNTESFIDYILANEFSLNYDSGKYSTYVYRDLGGKLSAGPLWDFNNAYDNDAVSSTLEDAGFFTIDRPFFSMLYRDERFTDQIIDRWMDLREDRLSDERLLSYIDDVATYLGPAVDRNYEVWGYTLDPEVIPTMSKVQKLSPDDRNPTSYGEALQDLKDFISTRAAWIDRHIDTLWHYSHESAVKMYNH